MTSSPRPALGAIGLVALVVVAQILFRVGAPPFVMAVGGSVRADLAEGIFKALYWAVPVILIARFAAGRWSPALERLGLTHAVFAGALLGFVATLPMLLSILESVRQAVASVLSYNGSLPRFDAYSIAGTAVLGPFAEEILFRGLLVGHLIAIAGWKPAPAVILSAVLFTLAHTVGGSDLPMLGSILAGGLVFGWLFVRWQSIWPAVSLHALINFYWDVSPTTIGIWHAVALGLAVAGTSAVKGAGGQGVKGAGGQGVKGAGGQGVKGAGGQGVKGAGGQRVESAGGQGVESA